MQNAANLIFFFFSFQKGVCVGGEPAIPKPVNNSPEGQVRPPPTLPGVSGRDGGAGRIESPAVIAVETRRLRRLAAVWEASSPARP